MEDIARAQPSRVHEHRARPGDDADEPVHPLVSDRRQTVHRTFGPVPHARRISVCHAGTIRHQVRARRVML